MEEIFEKARPEEVGIRSEYIVDFLERLERDGIPMHSVLLMRHGKLVAETYYAPYRADMPHRMFSVTKSFVSVAIGLLVQEGKIGLDDSITGYFPDKQPDRGPFTQLSHTTIRHMLKMQSPHSITTYRVSKLDDWTKTFFKVLPDHIPGTVYNYDTSSTHTLCALVERITGKLLLSYLREKCLDEVGFSKEAYALKDPVGVTQGGTGLVCTSRDLLAFTKLVADGGRHGNKQLLPADYVKEMTSWQVDNSDRASTVEEAQGYGYQFWRTRNNGYCCYGMGGQYGMVFPDKDIILVTTADTQRIKGGNQAIFNAFYDAIYYKLDDSSDVVKVNETKAGGSSCGCPDLCRISDGRGGADGADETNEAYKRLQECLVSRKLAVVPGKCADRNLNIAIEGFNDNCFHGISLHNCHGGRPDRELHVWGDLEYKELSGLVTIRFGEKDINFGYINGQNLLQLFPEYELNCSVTAGWVGEKDFVMKIQLLDECIGNIVLRISLDGNMATVMMNKCEETMFSEYNGFYYGKVV